MLDGEKKLIKSAILGEAEAFGLLYDRYQPQIYRFIYLKVSHREEAEDLTHQVFLKSWENIADYESSGFPFSSWLYRIARNQTIDYYRTKKSHLSLESEEELKMEDGGESLIKLSDDSISLEKIRKAIGFLSDDQQNVIILRFIEDLSPKEAAEIMNRTEGAVKLLQHRAINKLKEILKNDR
jgi:RNA polymerase sigma-70 factor (ECF subfamily)